VEASYLDCIRRPFWLIYGVYSCDFFCSFQPPTQSQSRYSEPENRDWRGRYAHAQFSPSREERSWDSNRDFGGRYDSRQQEGNQSNRQDQLNSQFSRAQVSSNQVIYFSFYLFIVIFLIFFLSILLFFSHVLF